MKKQVFAAAAAVIIAGMVSGCGQELTNEYVTVKMYKGLEVPQVTSTEVTDEMVEQTIQSNLSLQAEKAAVTDQAAQEGDWVNIDYTGYLDGETFDGGSAEGYDLELGSGTFIGATEEYAGFEEQIAGHSTGEEFDITVQFPDPYTNADMAGKVAQFHIVLNEIYTMVEPELTDEWVTSNSETSKSVDEYREEIRTQLEENNEATTQEQLSTSVQQALLDSLEIKSYPEEIVEAQVADMKSYYSDMAGYYNMELSDFIETYLQVSEDDFNAKLKENAEQTAAFDEAVKLIADKENLNLTDEEYEEKIQQYAEEHDAEDVEAYKEEVGEDVLKRAILRDEVTAYLVENCIQVEDSSSDE